MSESYKIFFYFFTFMLLKLFYQI